MRTSHVALVEHRPNRKHRISEALAEMKASVAAMNAAIYRRPVYKLN